MTRMIQTWTTKRGTNVRGGGYHKNILSLFSSPEHEGLRVSYCDSAVSIVSSVVNFLACVCSRGHIFSPIGMKLGQNVCLDEVSDEFENGSCRVKN